MCYTVQARILEWVAIPFSRGSSQPRDWTQLSCIAGRFFTSWATREAPWSKNVGVIGRTILCKEIMCFSLNSPKLHDTVSLAVLLLILSVTLLLWSWEKLAVPSELSFLLSPLWFHISPFPENLILFVWWVSSVLLSSLNTIKIRSKVAKENQITKSYVSNSKTICVRGTQEACAGFMFSLYPGISLSLLAHTWGRVKMLSVHMEMGFIFWTYTSQLAVVAFTAALRMTLSPSLT